MKIINVDYNFITSDSFSSPIFNNFEKAGGFYPVDIDEIQYFIEQYRKIKSFNLEVKLKYLFNQCNQQLVFEEFNVIISVLDPKNTFFIENLDGICANTSNNTIYLMLHPITNEFNTKRFSGLFIHELNHVYRNTRFNNQEHRNLFSYVIDEGLAEKFVEYILGSEQIGRWANKVNSISLRNNLNNFINNMNSTCPETILSYLRGDISLDLPHWYGYSLGFNLINYLIDILKTDIIFLSKQSNEFFVKNIDWECFRNYLDNSVKEYKS